jgi:hypothetical protein
VGVRPNPPRHLQPVLHVCPRRGPGSVAKRQGGQGRPPVPPTDPTPRTRPTYAPHTIHHCMPKGTMCSLLAPPEIIHIPHRMPYLLCPFSPASPRRTPLPSPSLFLQSQAAPSSPWTPPVAHSTSCSTPVCRRSSVV